jgi:DNA-binding ferritin-like protein
MAAAPVVILDALQSLYEAEQGSVFRLVGEGTPALGPVPPRVHELLQRLYHANLRHVNELAGEIRRLGDSPRARRPAELTSEESYLRFLSLRFLVPKLVREKELMIERYENALRALANDAPTGVTDLIRRQMAEQAANVDELQAAAERAA